MKNKPNEKQILDALRLKLQEKGVNKKEIKDLSLKFDVLIAALKDNLTTQIITKVVPNVDVTNLGAELEKLANNIIKNRNVTIETKPDWYEGPQKQVEIEGVVKVQNVDDKDNIPFFTEALQTLISFLGKLATGIFRVQKVDSDFLKPQTVALYNPYTKKYIDPDQLFNVVNLPGVQPSISVSGGGASVIAIKGAAGLGSDTLTVTTAGTRVQLPNIPCSSVTIQSHEDNGLLTNNGTIVAGGSNVIAASAGRKGYAIYPTQSQTFQVANANLIWIDSTDNAAKITYTYAN